MDALADFFTLQPTGGAETGIALATSCQQELEKHLLAKPNTQILDFRRASDYEAFHLPNSVNIPLETLKNGATRGSPFARPVDDCTMLEELWLELESLFTVEDKHGRRNPSAATLMAILQDKKILTMCYDGDSARVANSVLRAKGVNSESIYGGYGALANIRLPGSDSAQQSSHVISVEAY